MINGKTSVGIIAGICLLWASTLIAENNLLKANPSERLLSAVPNPISRAMKDYECNPINYSADEFIQAPTYLSLGTLSTLSNFAFLCEELSLSQGLVYRLIIQLSEHSSESPFFKCARSLTLPASKSFKPAGIWVVRKNREHFLNEGEHLSADGERIDAETLAGFPLMTIEVSDGVGALSYACISDKWTYAVLGP